MNQLQLNASNAWGIKSVLNQDLSLQFHHDPMTEGQEGISTGKQSQDEDREACFLATPEVPQGEEIMHPDLLDPARR